MHLVSTGRSTILSEFPDLETKYTYQHVNNEKTDFQFFSQKRLLLEVNEKSGLEFLRINDPTNQKVDIARIRRIKVDNLVCIACPKQGYDEVALGLSNGQVKLLNYKNTQFLHKFPADNSRNSVICLDYNASDEYISSVYENGQINVYGTKTKTKLQTINLDSNSTLGRFHPIKRFHLSIASYKGSVFIYDIQSKRKVFTSLDCHEAPCKDLCMSPSLPDVLLSVGYDCIINIFDTRKKTQPQQIRYCHPLSTAALSECGNFFSVGNLKGELISYDMRNTKSYLAAKKVHENAVTRIAFVPTEGENCLSFTSTVNQTHADTHCDTRKSLANADQLTKGRRDSFCDFLDFQACRGNEKFSSRIAARPDSFDWDALNKKTIHDDFRVSLVPNLNHPNNTVSSESQSPNPNSSLENVSSCGKENIPSPFRAEGYSGPLLHRRGEDICALQDRSNTDMKLNKIQEENELEVISPVDCPAEKDVGLLNISHKDLDGGCFLKLPAEKKSTPNNLKRVATEGSNKFIQTKSQNLDVLQELKNLRSEIDERFLQLESEVKFNAESNKWQIFTQNCDLWKKQMDCSEEIRTSLGILLQTDPFVNEYLRMKEENEILKNKLLQLGQQL